MGLVAALNWPSVALRVLASFERTGYSCDDCNESSDGEKGREADEHLFESSEVDFREAMKCCLLMKNGPATYLYIQREGPFLFPFHTAVHPACVPVWKDGHTCQCYSVTTRQQEKKQNLFRPQTHDMPGIAHWCLDQREGLMRRGGPSLTPSARTQREYVTAKHSFIT